MNVNKKISRVENDAEYVEKLCNEFCSCELLQKMVYNRLYLNGIPMSEYDDYISDANMLVFELAKKYDKTSAIPFEAYLSNAIKNRFNTWIRNSMRDKRCQKENYIDKDGRKVTRKVYAISLDEVNDECENDVTLYNIIASDFDIINEITKDEKEYSENMEIFLSQLSRIGRDVAMLLMEGYSPTKIEKALNIDAHRYNDAMDELKMFENISVLLRR